MAPPPPIVLPVSEQSITELGKVSGFAIIITMIAMTVCLVVCPFLLIAYYFLEGINSKIFGYPFSFIPWNSRILD